METSDDPMTIAMVGMGVGTGIDVLSTLEQGKQEEDIGKARAAVDIQNAEAARRASVEEAKIRAEKGRRLIATQKAQAAAGNVRLNVGAPLVIEAETKADIAKDIGFTLQRGREQESFYRSRARYEKEVGKARKRQSRWSAISKGFGGIATMGLMGYDAGWFTKKAGGLTKTGKATILRY
jgi:hypothetical protein